MATGCHLGVSCRRTRRDRRHFWKTPVPTVARGSPWATPQPA